MGCNPQLASAPLPIREPHPARGALAPEYTHSPMARHRDVGDDVVVTATPGTLKPAPTRRFASAGGRSLATTPSVLCVLDGAARRSATMALAAEAAHRLERRLVLVPLPDEASHAEQLASIAAAAVDERAQLILAPVSLSSTSTDGPPSSLELPPHVSCPVIAVPGPGGPQPRLDGPVVCGIDAADGSEHAVRAAAQLAVELGTRLALVHVAPVSQSRSLSRVHAHAVFGNALWRVVQRIDPAPPVDLVLEVGEPARRLVSAAEQAGAALIVIGAAARFRLASSVLARSDLPLMLVPNLNAAGDAIPERAPLVY